MNYSLHSSDKKESSPVDENTGEDFVLIRPSDPVVSHRLFYCKALRKLFRSFGLSPNDLSRYHADLMDIIYLYLLDGVPDKLELLLLELTDYHEDLWISLHGYQLMIRENLLPDLAALDGFLERSKRRTLQNLKRFYVFD